MRFADVGCGFGGLTVRLATLFPDKLVVGMELRDKVAGTGREMDGAAAGCWPNLIGCARAMACGGACRGRAPAARPAT